MYPNIWIKPLNPLIGQSLIPLALTFAKTAPSLTGQSATTTPFAFLALGGVSFTPTCKRSTGAGIVTQSV